MSLAGLCETWRSPVSERIRSLTLITTKPNTFCAEQLHHIPDMPVAHLEPILGICAQGCLGKGLGS